MGAVKIIPQPPSSAIWATKPALGGLTPSTTTTRWPCDRQNVILLIHQTTGKTTPDNRTCRVPALGKGLRTSLLQPVTTCFESVSRSVISDSCDLWTIARQAPLSLGFSRPEYWSGLPFPSLRDHPDPGIGPRDQTRVSCITGRFFTTEPPGKPSNVLY